MPRILMAFGMPGVYCLADESWVRQQLDSLTPTARHIAVARYAEVYQETFEAEPVSVRRKRWKPPIPYRDGDRGMENCGNRIRPWWCMTR